MMEIEGDSSQDLLHHNIPKWAQNLVKKYSLIILRKVTHSQHTYHALMTLYDVEQKYFE